jgi:hypothetical protein
VDAGFGRATGRGRGGGVGAPTAREGAVAVAVGACAASAATRTGGFAAGAVGGVDLRRGAGAFFGPSGTST